MRRLPIIWTSGLPEDQKEAFETYIRNSTVLIDRLTNILKAKGSAVSNKEQSEKDYLLPAWSHLQAHRNGYKEAIRDVLNLFNFRDQGNQNV